MVYQSGDSLVKERVNLGHRKEKKRGTELNQLEQIAEQAKDLFEYAQDILEGDFTEIDQIVEQEKFAQEQQQLKASSIEQRESNVAASQAGHEFNRRNYHKVVEILEPHLSSLPKSQLRRYNKAKEIINKG